MYEPDPIAALMSYDHWCTDKVAAAMEPLSPADLQRDFPIGLHTPHETLFHIVTVAEVWTDRSRAHPSRVTFEDANPGPVALPVTVLRRRYADAGRLMFDNLAELTTAPESDRGAAWFIRRNHLIHITTHAMHHRAQLLFMLKQLGVTDLIEGGDFGGWTNGPIKTSVDRASIAKHLA